MIEHTPTPWHVGPHYKSDVESRQGRVAECSAFGSPRAAANAAFIVRAANTFERARKALRWALDYGARSAEDNPLHASAFDDARGVLAEMEQEGDSMRHHEQGYTSVAIAAGLAVALLATIGISALNGHLAECWALYARMGAAFASLTR